MIQKSSSSAVKFTHYPSFDFDGKREKRDELFEIIFCGFFSKRDVFGTPEAKWQAPLAAVAASVFLSFFLNPPTHPHSKERRNEHLIPHAHNIIALNDDQLYLLERSRIGNSYIGTLKSMPKQSNHHQSGLFLLALWYYLSQPYSTSHHSALFDTGIEQIHDWCLSEIWCQPAAHQDH